MKRVQPVSFKRVAQRLNLWLVGDRRIRKCSATGWLGRVFSSAPMDMEQRFRLTVVGFQMFVLDGPRGRHSVPVLNVAKVALSHAQKRRAVYLRVATDAVVKTRVKFSAVLPDPGLFGCVRAVHKHVVWIPVGP